MTFSSTYFFILLAIIAGIFAPTQAAINNNLAIEIKDPILASFVSFVVGTVALFLYALATGVPISNLTSLKDASYVSLTGGFLGAFFVAASVIAIPKLGVALTFSLIIAGQMLITLLLDHYGFFGVPIKEVNVQRLLGIVLIIGGVILIRRF